MVGAGVAAAGRAGGRGGGRRGGGGGGRGGRPEDSGEAGGGRERGAERRTQGSWMHERSLGTRRGWARRPVGPSGPPDRRSRASAQAVTAVGVEEVHPVRAGVDVRERAGLVV